MQKECGLSALQSFSIVIPVPAQSLPQVLLYSRQASTDRRASPVLSHFEQYPPKA